MTAIIRCRMDRTAQRRKPFRNLTRDRDTCGISPVHPSRDLMLMLDWTDIVARQGATTASDGALACRS
jgi:hypothetical protein